MKKYLCIAIIAAMTIMGGAVLTGCGSTEIPEQQTEPTTQEETTTEESTEAQGDEDEFVQRITGLWLNGSQDAGAAKDTAHVTGITDVSMTQFSVNDGTCYISTYGDIKGEYDGDTVPDLSYAAIHFSEISADYTTAKGEVNGMEIEFDMGAPNDQVIKYTCGGYYTHCAYTGFSSFNEMNSYFGAE